MPKQRKMIGILTSQVEYIYQQQLLTGIETVALKYQYDVVVFSTFTKEYAKEVYQTGEINIFNMIQYHLLDGILIIPDTLRNPGLVSKLEQKIKEHFTGPVLSIDWELSDFESVCYPDEASMELLVSHLINTHGYRNFAIMTGPKEHQHAMRRLRGCLKALEKYKIPIIKDYIFYGDFWYKMGESVVDTILHSNHARPDVIVCASDTMAINVCSELQKHGIKVPNDIAVTGYDSILEGILHNPTITSTELKNEQLGIKAMLTLINRMEGLDLPTETEDTAKLLLGDSCGCHPSKKVLETADLKVSDYDHLTDFYSNYNYMMEELISSEDLMDCLSKVSWYVFQIGNFDSFYISLCENWDSVSFNQNNAQPYLIDGYTETMKLYLEKDQEAFCHHDKTFSTSIMLPALWEKRENPCLYYFVPLHFYDRCFGYATLGYHNRVATYDRCFRDWIRNINTALENLRVKNNLKWTNKQLGNLAEVDNLTKLYNRNGFCIYSQEFIEQTIVQRKKLLVILGDLDDLKKINDTYGHLEGDNAIKVCAKALLSSGIPFSKCFRFGGDEFILLALGEHEDNNISMASHQIKNYLDHYNQTSNKPYTVSLSLGTWFGQVTKDFGIDQAIQLADNDMFKIKHSDKSNKRKKKKKKKEKKLNQE